VGVVNIRIYFIRVESIEQTTTAEQLRS